MVCSQNHDQVGNRMLGDRLSATLSFEQQKLAAAAVLLSPFVPLLFMGEEYGETAPFQYFVSHSDPALIEAVRTGRARNSPLSPGRARRPIRRTRPPSSAAGSIMHLAGAGPSPDPARVLPRVAGRCAARRRRWPTSEKETLETTAFETESVLLVRQWRDGDEVAARLQLCRASRRSLELPFGRRATGANDSTRPTRAGAARASLAPARISPSATAFRLELPATSFVLYQRLPTTP